MKVTVEKLVAARPGCSEKWLVLVEQPMGRFAYQKTYCGPDAEKLARNDAQRFQEQ
jgi:hypothetical protein